MSGVLVVGNPGPLALAGLAEPAPDPDLVVALDGAAVPEGTDVPVVRWWRRAAPAGGPVAVERVIAPAGNGLWSTAPWPVRRDVFEVGTPPAGRVLVVDPTEADRSASVRELEARGITVAGAPWLTLAGLIDADIVLHGVGEAQALCGDALSVLAAGRLLITNAEPAFGLLPGIDHLRADGPAPAADLVEAVVARPQAFAALRRFGRMAAERHRAEDVYERLRSELARL